jgi:hypothetical protein
VSVDMDVVGVMAAYLPVVHVCTAQSREAFSLMHGTNMKQVSVSKRCPICHKLTWIISTFGD